MSRAKMLLSALLGFAIAIHAVDGRWGWVSADVFLLAFGVGLG